MRQEPEEPTSGTTGILFNVPSARSIEERVTARSRALLRTLGAGAVRGAVRVRGGQATGVLVIVDSDIAVPSALRSIRICFLSTARAIRWET